MGAHLDEPAPAPEPEFEGAALAKIALKAWGRVGVLLPPIAACWGACTKNGTSHECSVCVKMICCSLQAAVELAKKTHTQRKTQVFSQCAKY